MNETKASDSLVGTIDLAIMTNRITGNPRHQSVSGVLKHFRFSHLPPRLQAVSEPICKLAFDMADTLPEGPDLVVGLRDLLAAKDNFVRSLV